MHTNLNVPPDTLYTNKRSLPTSRLRTAPEAASYPKIWKRSPASVVQGFRSFAQFRGPTFVASHLAPSVLFKQRDFEWRRRSGEGGMQKRPQEDNSVEGVPCALARRTHQKRSSCFSPGIPCTFQTRLLQPHPGSRPLKRPKTCESVRLRYLQQRYTAGLEFRRRMDITTMSVHIT